MYLDKYKLEHPTDGNSRLDDAIRSLRAGIEDGRRVIRGIRPTVLDDSGVRAAIEDLIDHFASPDIHVDWQCDRELKRMPQAVEVAVYRIVQEALANAKKYSGTERIRIALQQTDDEVRLEFEDFGHGFDVKAARMRGFGLQGMAERVRLLDGEYRIESEPNVGTRIYARIPLKDVDD